MELWGIGEIENNWEKRKHLSRMKLDGEVGRICAAIEDGDGQLFICLVEFVSRKRWDVQQASGRQNEDGTSVRSFWRVREVDHYHVAHLAEVIETDNEDVPRRV